MTGQGEVPADPRGFARQDDMAPDFWPAGQGEGGAVLGEEAHAAARAAFLESRGRGDTDSEDDVRAAVGAVEPHVAALVAQAYERGRADGAAEVARGALELFAAVDVAENQESAGSRLLHVREYLVKEAGS